MATATPPVERLLEAVKKLSPDEYAEFTLRLGELEESPDTPSESVLIQRTKQQMPPAEARRLRILSRRSEEGALDPAELDDYQRLAARAERINASRVRALAELSRRRRQSVDQVKKNIGWREARHGA